MSRGYGTRVVDSRRAQLARFTVGDGTCLPGEAEDGATKGCLAT